MYTAILTLIIALGSQQAYAKVATTFLAADEILLGLCPSHKVKDCPFITAISTMAEDPKYSMISDKALTKALPKVAANLEALKAVAPEVVFAAEYNNPELLRALKNQKDLQVNLSVGATSVKDVERLITEIGFVTKKSPRAQHLIAAMQEAIIAAKLSKPQTALLYLPGGYTAGTHTLIHDVLQKMNIHNSAKRFDGWPKLNPEAVLMMNPEWLITVGDISEKKKVIDQLRAKVGWGQLSALAKKRVILVQEKLLHNSSHHLADLAKTIRKQILTESNP